MGVFFHEKRRKIHVDYYFRFNSGSNYNIPDFCGGFVCISGIQKLFQNIRCDGKYFLRSGNDFFNLFYMEVVHERISIKKIQKPVS